jgi:hypothetical protein
VSEAVSLSIFRKDAYRDLHSIKSSYCQVFAQIINKLIVKIIAKKIAGSATARLRGGGFLGKYDQTSNPARAYASARSECASVALRVTPLPQPKHLRHARAKFSRPSSESVLQSRSDIIKADW